MTGNVSQSTTLVQVKISRTTSWTAITFCTDLWSPEDEASWRQWFSDHEGAIFGFQWMSRQQTHVVKMSWWQKHSNSSSMLMCHVLSSSVQVPTRAFLQMLPLLHLGASMVTKTQERIQCRGVPSLSMRAGWLCTMEWPIPSCLSCGRGTSVWRAHSAGTSSSTASPESPLES